MESVRSGRGILGGGGGCVVWNQAVWAAGTKTLGCSDIETPDPPQAVEQVWFLANTNKSASAQSNLGFGTSFANGTSQPRQSPPPSLPTFRNFREEDRVIILASVMEVIGRWRQRLSEVVKGRGPTMMICCAPANFASDTIAGIKPSQHSEDNTTSQTKDKKGKKARSRKEDEDDLYGEI